MLLFACLTSLILLYKGRGELKIVYKLASWILENLTSVQFFYRRPFSTAFTYLNQVFNGLRRGSKAITPCLVLKYCKFGELGFLRHFWVGKPETSDFFNTKFRCFALKVRMFFSKKSDVFDIKHGIFYVFLRAFFNFFRINWKNQRKSVPIDS